MIDLTNISCLTEKYQNTIKHWFGIFLLNFHIIFYKKKKVHIEVINPISSVYISNMAEFFIYNIDVCFYSNYYICKHLVTFSPLNIYYWFPFGAKNKFSLIRIEKHIIHDGFWLKVIKYEFIIFDCHGYLSNICI